MNQWHNTLARVLCLGRMRPDRTGVGTLSLFGEQLRVDNGPGTFPAVTTKRLAFRQVAAELACFLRGYDSLEKFHSLGCHIWDGNGQAEYWLPRARFAGDLGRIYGVQWRDWRSLDHWSGGELKEVNVDQLKRLVSGLASDPFGRRHVVTALNPGEADRMCLPPCHVLFQAYVREEEDVRGRILDLRVDMRSVDLFLGLPFDIASYALLQRLLCKKLGYTSGELVFQLGDAHIYLNHLDQVRTVLDRAPMKPPELELDPDADLLSFHPDHAKLVGYESHPAVPAPLNV